MVTLRYTATLRYTVTLFYTGLGHYSEEWYEGVQAVAIKTPLISSMGADTFLQHDLQVTYVPRTYNFNLSEFFTGRYNFRVTNSLPGGTTLE